MKFVKKIMDSREINVMKRFIENNLICMIKLKGNDVI